MYLHADSIIAIYISQQYKAGFKSKVDQTGDNCYVQVHVPSHHSFYLSVCLDNAFPRQLCRNLKKLTWLVRRRKDKLSSSTQNKKFPTVCKVWTRCVTCCFRGSSFFYLLSATFTVPPSVASLSKVIIVAGTSGFPGWQDSVPLGAGDQHAHGATDISDEWERWTGEFMR